MKAVRALVLTGNGINCEREMAHACRLAGADADVVHVAEVFSGRVRLADYHFLNFPGGFSDGDDLGSAKAGAVRLKYGKVRTGGQRRFLEDLLRFIADGKLVLGVCNGFQLLVKLGLLPALDGGYAEQTASLTHNDSGRFEDRWVHLTVETDGPCVFTRGLGRPLLPGAPRGGEVRPRRPRGAPAGGGGGAGGTPVRRGGRPAHPALPGQSQRERGGHRRPVRPHGPSLRVDAPSGGVPPPDEPSPMDPGEPSRGGAGGSDLPKRGGVRARQPPLTGRRARG